MLMSSTFFQAAALLAVIVHTSAETLAAGQAGGLQVQADGTLSSSLLRREQPETKAAVSGDPNTDADDVKTSSREEDNAERSNDNLEASHDDVHTEASDDDVHTEPSKDAATASAAASENLTSGSANALAEKSISSARHRQALEATTTTTTFYYTLFEAGKKCMTKAAGYKTNVGNYQTEACFRYVLKDPTCGRYFHYGAADGVCDCIPAAETACNREDASYYNVYWIQKGGPEVL
eukprot:TRINITY_DN82457_c0_g1_i1.p1 TRINITY_DN82457_c0_g1~~TRINITY_DN82457_c0_g1_i1.p1  ORF type:complete len:236 (+),score=56.01 TRINITY_DN82457_c0_g1_i1:93-800(+)